MELTKLERQALKEQGMTHAVLLEERIGNSYGHTVVDKFVRARGPYGETFWGWWHEGEGAADIRWSLEKANA